MSSLDCFQGSGCILGINVPEISACWNSGGTVSGGSLNCSNSTIGFCLGGNQTFLAQTYDQLHYGPLSCKTSAAPRLSMKAMAALAVALLAAVLPFAAADTTCVHEAVNVLAGAENGTTLYSCESAFTLIAVDPAAAPSTTNTTLSGRCLEPVTFKVTQTRVIQSGVWWDAWQQDSGCNYCGLSSGACSRAITWSETTSATFNVGFDAGTESDVLGVIKANGKFNFGYTWGKSYTKGGTWTCSVNAGDVVRLYVQNQKGWADSQTRTMVSTRGCGGSGVSYSDWSGYQRSNWALDGEETVNLGCSSGVNAIC